LNSGLSPDCSVALEVLLSKSMREKVKSRGVVKLVIFTSSYHGLADTAAPAVAVSSHRLVSAVNSIVDAATTLS